MKMKKWKVEKEKNEIAESRKKGNEYENEYDDYKDKYEYENEDDETRSQSEKNEIIKDLNDDLDEIIDKSKSFEG